MTVSKLSTFSAPKGIPDYVPPNSAEFVAVHEGLLAAARNAGYGHIELPIFEDTGLFARGVPAQHRSERAADYLAALAQADTAVQPAAADVRTVYMEGEA